MNLIACLVNVETPEMYFLTIMPRLMRCMKAGGAVRPVCACVCVHESKKSLSSVVPVSVFFHVLYAGWLLADTSG
jgi:hypothetical protein